MSAIYGIINKNGKPVEAEMVQKMKLAMKHRAKDGGAEWIGDNAAFGFCHLVVYPNQEHERLPFESGDLIITANAHLHNREELVKKLGVDTKQYTSTPDSYLILKAFEKWGNECVHHLDGEYVYAIWNKVSKELFVSNDHIGYKALYYYETTEQFIFSSEIKGIQAVKETPNYFDIEVLIEFYAQTGDNQSTYNKEIKSLIAASILNIKKDNKEFRRYWHILDSVGKYQFVNNNDWYECLRSLFYKAIECRLNIEQPIGISLSGGLDSSSITCIISDILKKKNKEVHCFSSVLPNDYTGQAKDEREYIKIISEYCGNIVNHYTSADGLGPFTNLDKAFEMDETMPNTVHYMNIAVMEAAEHAGIKIFYTGIGGDYWVSAKGKFVISALINSGKWKGAFRLIKSLAAKEKRSWWNVFKTEYLLSTPFAKQYYMKRLPWEFETCLQPKYSNVKIDSYMMDSRSYMTNHITSGRAGKVMQRFDTRGEFIGMIAATPFFDKNLMEFMLNVPQDLLLEGGSRRNLFRKAMEGILPQKIQMRNNKSPYVNDSQDRMRYIGKRLKKLQTAPYSFIFEEILDKSKVEKLEHCLAKGTQSDHYIKTLNYRASLLIISTEIMLGLENDKFNF